MRLLPALVALFVALSPVQAGYQGAPRPGVIVIADDPGGVVDTFLMWIERIRASRIPVRIEGICHSACTLVLSLPRSQVCVTPTASLGFHLASQGPFPLQEFTAALVRRYYPQAVQEWIRSRGGLTQAFIYLGSAEIVEMGVFPQCKDIGG
jgi:hypothetical protein